MSPIQVTWSRTMASLRRSYSTAFAVAGFLAACVVTLSFGLQKAEGGAVSLAAVWSASVAPWIPVLAAFLGMDVWSDERRTGRLSLLLVAPVWERQFVIGKFLAVWTTLTFSLWGTCAIGLGTLAIHAPLAFAEVSPVAFLSGLVMLMLQGALWCAFSVAMSAFFVHAAAAAAATLVVLVALPRLAWLVLMNWSALGRTSFGVPLLETHVTDVVAGSVSSATLITYAVLTVLSLFIASKVVASFRLVGRGARSARIGVWTSVVLAFVLAGLVIALALRLDVSVELPIGDTGVRFSQRTRGILADNRDELVVTAFLSRTDPRFRPTAQFLRMLARQAKELGGARLHVRYVDPNWEFSAAERLSQAGERPGTVVFERGRRHVAVAIGAAPSERDCATAILSLVAPPTRRTVCWTCGHGEYDPDDYGPRGLSEIARELARDGYSNRRICGSGGLVIPNDCALVIVAGARDEFSRAELSSLEAYLRQGGRLLVLTGSAEGGGVSSLLPAWGVRPVGTSPTRLPTLNGTDIIVSDFADHAITAPLAGSRIVLDRPVAFETSAAVENGTGADRIDFTSLVRADGTAVAACVERGAGTGSDLALRPTRIVAIGDASFAVNAPLLSRGYANRDFFLNSIAWLSGTDAAVSAGADVRAFTSGMDRAARLRFFLDGACCAPLSVFVLLLLVAWLGRRRA